MSWKAVSILLVIVAIATGLVYFYFFKSPMNNQPPRFEYQKLVDALPDLAEKQETLGQQDKYAELGAYLESKVGLYPVHSKERLYLQYIAMRAYVNAARRDANDAPSFEKAVQIGQELLSDQDIAETAPNFVAFSVDVLDRLAYPSTPEAVQKKFISQTFFAQKFADPQKPSDVMTFRKNLLKFGNALFRVTNIKMKLSLLSLSSLRATASNPTAYKIQKEQLGLMIRDAESSLAQDRQAGAYPFEQRGYLAEILFTRARLAQEYTAITHETPMGSIDDLYQEALKEAKENNPFFVTVIQKDYDYYRNKQAK